jgi:hypothetical protein
MTDGTCHSGTSTNSHQPRTVTLLMNCVLHNQYFHFCSFLGAKRRGGVPHCGCPIGISGIWNIMLIAPRWADRQQHWPHVRRRPHSGCRQARRLHLSVSLRVGGASNPAGRIRECVGSESNSYDCHSERGRPWTFDRFNAPTTTGLINKLFPYLFRLVKRNMVRSDMFAMRTCYG